MLKIHVLSLTIFVVFVMPFVGEVSLWNLKHSCCTCKLQCSDINYVHIGWYLNVQQNSLKTILLCMVIFAFASNMKLVYSILSYTCNIILNLISHWQMLKLLNGCRVLLLSYTNISNGITCKGEKSTLQGSELRPIRLHLKLIFTSLRLEKWE